MTEHLLHPCGAIVTLIAAKIDGMITCQNIRFDRVTYEVTYFLLGEQKTVWVHEQEFVAKAKKTKRVGFLTTKQ